MPAPGSIKSLTLPAPTGGINTVDAIGAMPATDCIYAYNVIASELGLRARFGYSEWCTGLTGATDNLVRSVIPFTGTRKNGSTDRLFATTSSGMWDCTTSTDSPTFLFPFAVTTGEAGYGQSTVVNTPAGRFLVYCDEENGAYFWVENSASWGRIALGVTVPWAASTIYTVGNRVTNGVNSYECTVGGTSAGAGGPTGTGGAIVDNTVTWKFYQGPWVASTAYLVGMRVTNGVSPKRIYVCTVAGTSAAAGGPSGTATSGIVDNTARWGYVTDVFSDIGTSLADQQAGFSANPQNFVQAVVWKSRLWFVERDTTRAWYMPVNSLFGTANSFDFGSRMRAGGPLVGLYNWSYDAGSGIDSLLVGLSTTGDVVIFQGTDPSTVATFGLKGTWSVGAVPYGRRIATDFGGDMLVMSTLGIVPLSRLVVGQPVVGGPRTVYATEKISNAFSQAAVAGRGLQGWQVVMHPGESALMVLVPFAAGATSTQLVMSFITKGWTTYRDLPMYTAAPWNGTLYFGTADGRVCINSGYVDGITLADPQAFTPVNYSFLSAYSNLGNQRQKRVMLVRPSVLSQIPNPAVRATARFRFDTTEPDAPNANPLATGNVWDVAKWDGARWAGDYSTADNVGGAAGCGREVAIAVRGLATSRTVFASVDVHYVEGGLL